MKFIFLFTSLAFPILSSAFEIVAQAKPGVYGSSKNVNCPIEIKPGKGIGAIELGRNIKEIEGFGMDIKSVQGSKTILVIGRYSVNLTEQGNVMLVEMELDDAPNCLIYNKQKIRKNMSSKQLAKIFKSCKAEESRDGGNLIECDGISIGTGGWGGRQKTPQLKILAP
jgi:hypothetical protein